jgi:hypothetical protein
MYFKLMVDLYTSIVYVDDIILAGRKRAFLVHVKDPLLVAFYGRDLGSLACFLGISIDRDRAEGSIKLSHKCMVLSDLVSSFGLSSGNPLVVPMNASVDLSSGDPLDTSTEPYRELVGRLMHLAVTVRPDISYAVGVLARYLSSPTTAAWQAAKGVLRYLSCTSRLDISFGSEKPGVLGHCDSDYAGDLDTVRRSATGYVFLLNGGAISWQSKRQQIDCSCLYC